MEFTEIWDKIALFVTTGLGSISVGAVISWIVAIVNSSKIKKALAQFRAQEIASLSVEQGIDRLKSMTFEHDIKPLVESELQKVYEYSVAMVNNELKNMENKYNQIINILEALSKYFDNSIGVSDEAKEELKEEIEKAKTDAEINEPVKATVVVAETPKTTTTTTNSTQNTTKASR